MDEFDLMVDAIEAGRMIGGAYGSGHDGAARIDEVLQMLSLRTARPFA